VARSSVIVSARANQARALADDRAIRVVVGQASQLSNRLTGGWRCSRRNHVSRSAGAEGREWLVDQEQSFRNVGRSNNSARDVGVDGNLHVFQRNRLAAQGRLATCAIQNQIAKQLGDSL
jgi:hypothetical protein